MPRPRVSYGLLAAPTKDHSYDYRDERDQPQRARYGVSLAVLVSDTEPRLATDDHTRPLFAGPDSSRLSIPSGGRKNPPGITRYRRPNARARRDDKFVLVERLRRIVEGERTLMRH